MMRDFSNDRRRDAFTLIEMIIAITVFTVFIGFVMSSYIAFHRAQQEASATRSLLLEVSSAMSTITDAVKTNTIDYEAYSGPSSDVLSGIVRSRFGLNLFGGGAKNTDTLYLLSSDGETSIVFEWNEDEETLTMQVGEDEPIPLHADATRVTDVDFKIFPAEDPYDSENVTNDDLQYQPSVQISLNFSVPGRVREEVTIDLKTMITSRFYQ